ncbi:hypothetical protein [Burkholderia sp. MBR-1]|uniref:hypothetical protein n=1 Tax=Burkholderia sp. MBR-1 TaxID=2732364 RepID=UPI0015EEEF29|nr:hypothetical protein [Burkholderia sp. MBR-1]QMI49244.1 hypothetical protein MBR110_27815 [Burkholderia sp. MBR-1]
MSNQQLIGEGKLNSTDLGRSNIRRDVEGETLAFLHTGTGEIVVVPPEESGNLLTESRVLSDAVAQFHSANLAVQTLDEYRRQHFNNTAECTKANAALEFALQWQDEAHQAYHDIFAGLEQLPDDAGLEQANGSKKAAEQPKEEKEDSLKLNGTAKKMTELVSLKRLSPEELAKKKADEKKGKFDESGYTKILLEAKSVKYLKDKAKNPVAPPEMILYVRRDKIHWPKMKVLDNKGWKDVFVKDSTTGKKSIDRVRLGKYVASKASDFGVSLLKEHFKEDLEYSRSDTADWAIFKVCDSWNKELHVEKNGKHYVGSDINLSANAQLMRYSYGVSLDPDLSFSEKKISVRAEGHAEINAAKGEAKATLSFPRQEGWIWTLADKKGVEQPIVAIVCTLTISASALVGASVAVELSLQSSASEVTEKPPKVKGKPGPKGRGTRRQNRMELKKGDKVRPVGLEAGANVFIGAKADGSIEGALKWRDPENEKKGFEAIASISAGVGGMVGLAAGFNLSIEYLGGMFRLAAHASLCFGPGAEGLVTFAVSKEQATLFGKCLFYKLIIARFENTGLFRRDAFDVLKHLKLLAALDGSNSFLAYYGQRPAEIQSALATQLASATPQQLASAAKFLDYAPPESKGMLICTMCQTQIASGDPSTLKDTQEGILSVLKTAVIVPELDNIIQHSTPDGGKTSVDAVMAELGNLFKLGMTGQSTSPIETAFSIDDGAISESDQVALSGDFGGWYDAFRSQLADSLPRGYSIAPAGSVAYEALRDATDHPLFTSIGLNAFYQEDA